MSAITSWSTSKLNPINIVIIIRILDVDQDVIAESDDLLDPVDHNYDPDDENVDPS